MHNREIPGEPLAGVLAETEAFALLFAAASQELFPVPIAGV